MRTHNNNDLMMPLRKLLMLLLLLAFVPLTLFAQSISVASFAPLPDDLTANTAGTIVMDQNGDKCALIKVETTQTGFTFDVGSLGVVKNEQKVGEIWVYVPAGVKRMTVAHPQLGVLRDYDFGMSVQKARTYLMKLTTGTVTTVVEEAVTSQFLLFQVTPAHATVLVKEEAWTVNEGVARKYVPFGTYDYRVMAQDYFTSSGKVQVHDPENPQVVKVELKPNFAQVTIRVENNAEIWVNGERKGIGSWTGNLGGGEYRMEARLAGHRPSIANKTVTAGNGAQTITLTPPTPIYGKLMVSTMPDFADIYIDDVKVGQTPRMLSQVLVGTHTVTLKKTGYADYTKSVTIAEAQTATLDGQMEKSAASLSSSNASGDQEFTVKGVLFVMKAVQGGTFQMGATSEQKSPDDDEKPVHSVTLSDYSIGETEVTQALWTAVMGTTVTDMAKKGTYSQTPNGVGDNYPMYYISWDDCQTFIQKLNQLTGQRFRLPTEAEWEYAARGGTKSLGYQYSGGNSLGAVAWYTDNSGSATHPVKTKSPNELGLYDMSGNVWEWCQDWYGGYSSSTQTNPKGPASGSDRVLRGGSWGSLAWFCRVAYRDRIAPDDRDNVLGLRLAL